VRSPLPAVVLSSLLIFGASCCEEGGRDGAGARGKGIVTVDAAGVDSLRESSGARLVLVNVWATWCAPCIEEMPGLVRLRGDYQPSELEIIMVSTDDPEDLGPLVVPALDSAGVEFRTYILAPGNDDEFIRSMNREWTGALPATFMFLRGSNTTNWFIGGRSYDDLRRAVSGLLGE